ncbi:MAG: RNA 2',3'-cyclic phosphodiesterase [Coriobacteriia bacterium]|nr:RNA 2',3'-cyclic phosphodiesterase [Coriobacteriia bacterium]
MRAFIALELPDAFWRETIDLARQLSLQVEGRFTRREGYHLTLAFLGNIDDAEKGLAMDAMDAACEGLGPIALASDGLGKFGRARDATLWMGVKKNERLEELAKRIRAELDARSLSYDEKPFRAHITLARRARLPRTELPPLAFPLDDVATKVTLFKSELSHEGATYKPLYTIALG